MMSGRTIEPGVAERLQIELSRLAGVRAAADRLNDRVLLVRLLSVSGAAFHGARRWVRDWGGKPLGRARDRGAAWRLRDHRAAAIASRLGIVVEVRADAPGPRRLVGDAPG